MMEKQLRSLGIDIGSTTAKLVLVENEQVIFERYQRHFSRIRETLMNMLHDMAPLLREKPFTVAISGSAGLGAAQGAGIFFAQKCMPQRLAFVPLPRIPGWSLSLGARMPR